MARKLQREEAEAVFSLRGADAAAFRTLISYFERRYDEYRDKCVDTRVETVQVEQGKARAFREISEIEEDAQSILDAINSK